MKKHFYLVFALISMAFTGYAQPQFSYQQTPAAYNTIPFSNSTNLRQWLYYPSNFPGMPPGYIDKIYIKSYTNASPSFALLTVKMGTTNLNNFASGPFAGGLTTVFQGAYSATTITGNWMVITLQTPFYYDSLQNFVVECSQIGQSPGFNVMQTNSGVPGRSLYGYMTSSSGTMQNAVAQLGLDLQMQSTPLDVKIKEFNGRIANTQCLLTWKVAEENNMDRYEIERSLNGLDFEHIGLVYSEPQTSGDNQYSFTDIYLPASNGLGKVFYRLRSFDLAGGNTVSSTVSLSLSRNERSFNVIASPIPFTKTLNVAVDVEKDQSLFIIVTDMIGQRLLNKTESIRSGTTNFVLSELEELPPGTYFLSAATMGNTQTIVIIKN